MNLKLTSEGIGNFRKPMAPKALQTSMTDKKMKAFEKRFKKEHGLLEENLTPEEAYALRVYIEALEETIGYHVQAGLVTRDQVGHLPKYKNDHFRQGYNKLLGIGGTLDDSEDTQEPETHVE